MTVSTKKRISSERHDGFTSRRPTRAIFAALSAILVVATIHASEAGTDDWRSMRVSSDMLAKLPPLVRVVPTKLDEVRTSEVRGPGNGTNRRVIGIGAPLVDVVVAAYGGSAARMFFAALTPTARYDFVCTVPSEPGKALQEELRKELGLIGRHEMRETDVLLLRVREANAGGLKPGAPARPGEHSIWSATQYACFNEPIEKGLRSYLEEHLDIPVIDETNLIGRYNIDFTWAHFGQYPPKPEKLKQIVLEDLGLDLVPARKSIEVLVLDRAKL